MARLLAAEGFVPWEIEYAKRHQTEVFLRLDQDILRNN